MAGCPSSPAGPMETPVGIGATKGCDMKAAGASVGVGAGRLLDAFPFMVRLDVRVEARAGGRVSPQRLEVLGRDAEVAVERAVAELHEERAVFVPVAQSGQCLRGRKLDGTRAGSKRGRGG